MAPNQQLLPPADAPPATQPPLRLRPQLIVVELVHDVTTPKRCPREVKLAKRAKNTQSVLVLTLEMVPKKWT
jgi:hypothetical protein